jgi:hypothetical protein
MRYSFIRKHELRYTLVLHEYGMNTGRKTLFGLSMASLAVVLLFPPFDQYSFANSTTPIFGGFFFYYTPPPHGVVNTSMLFLEVFVVLINTAIGWLLLRDKPASAVKPRRVGYQNAVLILAAVNLIVIVLFPPFESVFALTNAALPTFEGFFFLFSRQHNHTIVTTLLYIEVIFVLVNAAIAWIMLKDPARTELTPEQARTLAMELRRNKG